MVVVVHHLESSRSLRILWLLEELGVKYEIKHYERMSNKLAPPELKEVHPLGKSPVITDDGLTIAETGLIVEYLIDKYGTQLAPPRSDTAKFLQYKYWLHFSEGSAQPLLIMNLMLNLMNRGAPFFFKPVSWLLTRGVTNFYVGPNIQRNTEFMNDAIKKNPKGWFVDDFSGADIILSFPVEGTQKRMGLSEYPELQQWLDKIHARPAYKRALEKGGKFEII